MAYIVSYQKTITRDTTKQLDLPESATELCTIDGITYVSMPDDVELVSEQPVEYQEATLTDELRARIKSQSTHVQLIDERVKAKIAERYSLADELKEIRNSSLPSFAVYADYVEGCRQWGSEQKAALGLSNDTSKKLRALSRRQFKLVLIENDLITAIETAIAGIEDGAIKARIEIEYKEATSFVRESESIAYMSALLGLNDEQLDAMWAQALTL